MGRNMRLLSHNEADRATLMATDAAPECGPEWLKTDRRGEHLRILSDEGTITATWPDGPVPAIGLVALPACNLSASSEIRVRVYEDVAGAVLLHDSEWQWAASGPLIHNWNVRQPVNVNAFSDGATCVAVWLSQHAAGRRVRIDLRDPNRDYLDISRLVIGQYIAPRYGAAYGASVGIVDLTTNTRAASGDIVTNWGAKRRTLDFDLQAIVEEDRPGLLRVLQAGIGRRHFVSLLSEHSDPTIVQSYMLYGTLRATIDMAFRTVGLHQSQFQFEEF